MAVKKLKQTKPANLIRKISQGHIRWQVSLITWKNASKVNL